MHVFFCGIGGAGLGPLALIAKQAGFEVSGSDKQNSKYIDYLKSQGITSIHIGQDKHSIEQIHSMNNIDWFVYSSAISKENSKHPELVFAKKKNIISTKRDEFLNKLIQIKNQKMVAVAGTHGKTTTTAMVVWLFKNLGIDVSYSVGAMLGFGNMGEFNPNSTYFVYEADEYDHNFLSFNPELSVISGIDYDHPDIYPTREEYYTAFVKFLNQSRKSIIWYEDAEKIGQTSGINNVVLASNTDLNHIKLMGKVNRADAHAAMVALEKLGLANYNEMVDIINNFPGISRRFEEIVPNLYSDYAHTPEKILGALQLAHEVAGFNVVVVYEGLHNTRQHFIKDSLENIFAGVKKLYVVPSYLAREDKNLEMLTPEKLCELIKKPALKQPAKLDSDLKQAITDHTASGDMVLCFSAGGGGSLDEWLRVNFPKSEYTKNLKEDLF